MGDNLWAAHYINWGQKRHFIGKVVAVVINEVLSLSSGMQGIWTLRTTSS
ncbi:hypothetical protein CLOSTMETH_02801 [[Clostridium] methylpentosum DSM 5476]|uniref:Uncharacterized protein n=1 Tax=[Clostridium] methylpentosum DSM 5476 TaxID=537013 RepID=C0EG09_9FIRM|nr:hypothetical protein CLOSTMETH_02801 [[Clostridium] methylpentosum DSM 5476]